MKKFYSYKWYELNLHVDCTKCGNNIVFQNFEGNPECNECGFTNQFGWPEVLKEVRIKEALRGNGENIKLLGGFSASANTGAVKEVNCYHCKSPVNITDDTDVKNYQCTSCNQLLHFKEYPEFEDLVFYKSGDNSELKNEGIKPIAVRCVSCGAPLSVDPTKNNFNCSHCSTENILPMAMRYKVVIADIFVAERKTSHPKLLAFEKDGKLVKQSLRENGKESFADAELDQILLNKKDDVGVYNIIVNEYKYLPSDKVLIDLFATSTNQQLIDLVGKRLQKSKEEIESRIEKINPRYKENKQSFDKVQQKRELNKKVYKIFSIRNIIYLIITATIFYVFYIYWKTKG